MVAYFMEKINKDAAYKAIAKAKFPPLSYKISRKLDCDLYELDDHLLTEIERTVWQRDSIMQADTLSAPRPETFLQMLYRRKMRILLASQPDEGSGASEVVETTTTSVRQ